MENSRPLAVVGAKTITEQDVSEVIAGMGPRAGSYNTPQGRAAVLEQLIGQALFLTDAKKNMLEYDPAFKQQLARVKDDLLVQFAISKALERVKVTEDEIKSFTTKTPTSSRARRPSPPATFWSIPRKRQTRSDSSSSPEKSRSRTRRSSIPPARPRRTAAVSASSAAARWCRSSTRRALKCSPASCAARCRRSSAII